MNAIRQTLAALFLALIPATSYSVIDGQPEISIDFTDPADAAAKATWSHPKVLTVSKEGLGAGPGPGIALTQMGWIQTEPLAIGLWWRPPTRIEVSVRIEPPPHDITIHTIHSWNGGPDTFPYSSDLYIRHSPDLAHWSSWQRLERYEPLTDDSNDPALCYTGTVAIPKRERDPYRTLLNEYAKLDVPWPSDEEAAVQWILSRDPAFFSRHIPFIGYVEFLYEGTFYSGQRIRSFKGMVAYGLGGFAALSKHRYAPADLMAPWRFKATATAPASAPGNAAEPRD